MNKIDLWEDEIFEELMSDEDEEEIAVKKAVASPKHILKGKDVEVQIDEYSINLFSKVSLPKEDVDNLLHNEITEKEGYQHYSMKLTPVNAFVLRHALTKYRVIIEKEQAKILKNNADKVWVPTAKLTEDKKHVQIRFPNIKAYREIVDKLGGYPASEGYRIPLTKVLDLESLSEMMESNLPKIQMDKEVLMLNREPILGFDGKLNSLKDLPLSLLNVISANSQSWKALKSSKETLEEKLNKMGINNLYDMLFWLPRRYIDKSNPQDLVDLIIGETAVVVGEIENTFEMNTGRGGSIFIIKLDNEKTVRATFFNQKWLLNKFKIGQEVLITGKFSWWNDSPQIGGASIEHAEEAAALPIVPVYNQSPSKGITTNLIMSANRELLSRLGDIELPVYFRQKDRMDYCEALMELHFPSSLTKHSEAINDLAYYELVYMQLIIQEAKESSEAKKGVKLSEDFEKLQAKAIRTLPFELTASQKRGLVVLNKKMSNEVPSATLLSADVGAGKSVVAQLSSLKAIDSGFQAALIAPTDILARQLFSSFKRLIEGLEDNYGTKINIDLLSGSMKAAEKKEVLKKVADGTTQIIVGTHSLMTSVKYNNLGYVVIDEQQKFGAEQRTALLNSREDGRIPDLMMMTATPIPRTTAQVIYGDVEMIELNEKPPGRLPIITEWIEQDPEEIIEELANPLWGDIIEECQKGNQAFVITPLISESEKIDSASAERTFQKLSELSLSGLNVGIVHGQMKQDKQAEEMKKFKDKEYDVMVASTVVEVGVDISDATRVVILSADRMGGSSLHQIRGRVGRNSKQSKCYLVSLGRTENSQRRLQSLVESENGFDIAQADLELRGEGKIFSIEQSGKTELMFATLGKNKKDIQQAKEDALRILKSPFRKEALKDSKERFQADERLM